MFALACTLASFVPNIIMYDYWSCLICCLGPKDIWRCYLHGVNVLIHMHVHLSYVAINERANILGYFTCINHVHSAVSYWI